MENINISTTSTSTNADDTQMADDHGPQRSSGDELRSSQRTQSGTSTGSSKSMASSLRTVISDVASRLTGRRQRRGSTESLAQETSPGNNEIDRNNAVDHHHPDRSTAGPETSAQAADSQNTPSGTAQGRGEELTPPTSRSHTQAPHQTAISEAGPASSDHVSHPPTPPPSGPSSANRGTTSAQPTLVPDGFTLVRRYPRYRHYEDASPADGSPQSSGENTTQLSGEGTTQPSDESTTQTSGETTTQPSSENGSDKAPSHKPNKATSRIRNSEWSELYKQWTVSQARANPIEYHKNLIRQVRGHFQTSNIRTRAQRRDYLQRYLSWNLMLMWLSENPGDMWASKEELRAQWSPMYADGYAATAEERYKRFGYHREMVGNPPEEEWVEEKEEAEVHRVHKRFFGEEWASGEGRWGLGTRSVEEEDDVGPMGERMEDL